jgi:hypothetical protein
MKCKQCGAEMELWQTTRNDGVLIKRYRCVCGNECNETIELDKPKKKNQEIDKEE